MVTYPFIARYRVRDAEKAVARIERRTALARRSRPDLLPGLAEARARAVARVKRAHVERAEADAIWAEAREQAEAVRPDTSREWIRAGLWGAVFAFWGIFPSDGPPEG